MRIGILAIQGSVIEHKNALIKAAKSLKIKKFEVIEVRLPKDLLDLNGELKIQGIILPGGESTTQLRLLKRYGLFEPLKNAIRGAAPFKKPLPVWGTCAGAILLAKEVKGNLQNQSDALASLAVMDISADRNAYGTQIDSFSEKIDIDLSFDGTKNRSHRKITAVFIRAPKLSAICGGSIVPPLQILATRDDEPIAILQGSMLATGFHPELTNDTTLHEFFIKTSDSTYPSLPAVSFHQVQTS